MNDKAEFSYIILKTLPSCFAWVIQHDLNRKIILLLTVKCPD